MNERKRKRFEPGRQYISMPMKNNGIRQMADFTEFAESFDHDDLTFHQNEIRIGSKIEFLVSPTQDYHPTVQL